MDPPGPGRPAGGHGLTAALIARQDAQSRRTARQINGLLETHVRPEEVRLEREFLEARLRRRLLALTDQLTPVIAAVADQLEVHAILSAALKEALTAEASDLSGPEQWLPDDPTLAPAEECPDSETLDEARARSARLRARFIELQMRARPC